MTKSADDTKVRWVTFDVVNCSAPGVVEPSGLWLKLVIIVMLGVRLIVVLPFVPLIVNGKVPAGVVPEGVMVTTDVPPLSVIVSELNAALTPVGRLLALRPSAPLKPSKSEAVTV